MMDWKKTLIKARDYILGWVEFEGTMVFSNSTTLLPMTTLYTNNIGHLQKFRPAILKRLAICATIILGLLILDYPIASRYYEPKGYYWMALLPLLYAYWTIRVRKYGIVVRMNSGTTFSFLNRDKKGSDLLFNNLTAYLDQGHSFRYEAHFAGGQVVVQNSTGVIVGDGNQQQTSSETSETEPSYA